MRDSFMIRIGAVMPWFLVVGLGLTSRGEAQTLDHPVALVTATTETTPVASEDDAADDSVIWVHPSDPVRSTIIGTNKQGGLVVYGLDGLEVHSYPIGRPNNVDLRKGFSLYGEKVDLVGTEDRSSNTVRLFAVQSQDGSLIEVSDGVLDAGKDVYGCGFYHSHKTGRFHFFVGSKNGTVSQFQLEARSGNRVGMTKVRTLNLDDQVEGIAADDEAGVVYIGEEKKGVWKFSAEPDGGTSGSLISKVGRRNPLKKEDVEGITIYKTGERSGFILVSSQGSNEYVVFDREAQHLHLGTFQIGNGIVDGVQETDGIDVTSANLGAGLEKGLFVAQDGDNPGSNQNFKLVPWSRIEEALPQLKRR
jgi:3-phytase